MNLDAYQCISLNIFEYQWTSKGIIEYRWISSNINSYRWILMNVIKYKWIWMNIWEYQWISMNMLIYDKWVSLGTVAWAGVSVSIDTFVVRIGTLWGSCRNRILENVCRNKSMHINTYQWTPMIVMEYHWASMSINDYQWPHISEYQCISMTRIE